MTTKSCGTCEHWSKNAYPCGFIAVAKCKIEFDKVPALYELNISYVYHETRSDAGSECPLWKEKNEQ